MSALLSVANSKRLVTILTLAATLLIVPDNASAKNRNHGNGGGGPSMGGGPKPKPPQPVTRTVRDHRTPAPATINDHRAAPKVTDHRKQAGDVPGARKVESPARGGVRVTSNGPRKSSTKARYVRVLGIKKVKIKVPKWL